MGARGGPNETGLTDAEAREMGTSELLDLLDIHYFDELMRVLKKKTIAVLLWKVLDRDGYGMEDDKFQAVVDLSSTDCNFDADIREAALAEHR